MSATLLAEVRQLVGFGRLYYFANVCERGLLISVCNVSAALIYIRYVPFTGLRSDLICVVLSGLRVIS